MFLPCIVACSSKNGSVLCGSAQLCIALARLGGGLAGNFTRESYGTGEEIALNQAINDSELERFFCFHRIAVSTHLHCLRYAREAWQTLRSRRSGNDAELYFWLSDLRARSSHTVVP